MYRLLFFYVKISNSDTGGINISCWKILGISRTTDERKIKEAYANKIKTNHPEDNQNDYLMINRAYKEALRYARNMNQRTKISLNIETKLEDKQKIEEDKEDINEEYIELKEQETEEEDVNTPNEKILIDVNEENKTEQNEVSFEDVENIVNEIHERDRLIIDDFWQFITDHLNHGKGNQNMKWKTITNQWFFTYYGKNDYFQNKFWEFFTNYDPFRIRLKTRYNIVYPFLVKMSNITSVETRIKYDVVNLIVYYSHNRVTQSISKRVLKMDKKSVLYKVLFNLTLLITVAILFMISALIFEFLGMIFNFLEQLF